MSAGPLMRGREKEKESFFLFKSWRSAFSSQEERKKGEKKREIPISILPTFLSPLPNIALKLGFNCEFSSLFCLVFPLPSFVVCASHS